MAGLSACRVDPAALGRLGYHYVEVLVQTMQRGVQAIGDFLIETTRKRQHADQTVSSLDEPDSGPLVKRRHTAVALHATTAVPVDHYHTGPAVVTSTGDQTHTVSQQQCTPPQGWKSPFSFTMGQPSTRFGQPRRSRNPHQNLYIPESIFKTPVQLGRLRQAQQLKPCEGIFSVTRSLAATPLEASHSGTRAAAGLASAPLVSSRPTAFQHAPAELPFLQRFIMNKQMQQEQRAQHDSQTRTPAECGHDAASLSVLAAEDPMGSSDEQSEQGVTDVPMADWEDLPADHGYVQDSDHQMLSAPPSLTAVDAVPSAAAMGTDASVGNVTAPDTMLAEVAAVEPTVAVSSPTGDAAAAAAGSGTGGYESRHDGGHRVADKYSTTEGRMAAATGGYGHIQQPSGEHVGLGFAEPSKMGSEPSASLPGPLWQGPPSICLPFPLLPLPLLPFSASMASRGPPAFVPMSPAAIAASVDAKQEEVARRARLAQEVAEKAAQEAAALQRVLGGMVEIRQDANDSMADADMEDEYAQSPPAAEGESCLAAAMRIDSFPVILAP
ncbi:hypothetical protein WJX82_003055 [Trebouxia sp. C0006]